MSPRLEREAAQDDVMAWSASPEYAEHFGRTHMPLAHPAADMLPAHLAACISPRRNLCSEFSAMPTEQLMAEAEAAMTRLLQSGRPTDYAVVVALVRRLARKPAMDGALWIDDMKGVSHG